MNREAKLESSWGPWVGKCWPYNWQRKATSSDSMTPRGKFFRDGRERKTGGKSQRIQDQRQEQRSFLRRSSGQDIFVCWPSLAH